MSFLVANLPPVECFVRKEYLYNFTKGQGELEPCIWVSAKSIKGRAWYIESLLPNYAALYDKLPISAYVWKADVDHQNLLDLTSLQLWDCFSYEFTIIEKNTLRGLRVKTKLADNNIMWGNYMFTLDNVVADPNILDNSFTQIPSEHKSFNLIKLDNGQFALLPNNRCLFIEPSHTPSKLTKPDIKASNIVFSVEGDPARDVVFGDSDEFFYEESKLKE